MQVRLAIQSLVLQTTNISICCKCAFFGSCYQFPCCDNAVLRSPPKNNLVRIRNISCFGFLRLYCDKHERKVSFKVSGFVATKLTEKISQSKKNSMVRQQREFWSLPFRKFLMTNSNLVLVRECYIFSHNQYLRLHLWLFLAYELLCWGTFYHIIPFHPPAPGYHFQISRFPDWLAFEIISN